jgi:hypothetical protein
LTLEPGASADLEFLFSTTSQGIRSNWFAILSNDPSRNGVTYVYVQGRAAIFEGPRLQAASSASAGSVPVGGVGEATLAVSNFGAQPLLLSAQLAGEHFSLGTPFPAEVGPGSALPVFIRFAPGEVGERTGTLTLTTNDPTTPTWTVALSGEGLGAPTLSVTPAPISFGIVEGGTEKTVILANTGTADLTVSGIEVDEPFMMSKAVPLPAIIPPGGRQAMTIGLGAGVDGNVRGMLRILSSDPGVPRASLPMSAHVTTGEVSTAYFAAAAKAPGVGGADWASRGFFVNPTDEAMAVDISFRPRGVRRTFPPDAGLWVPAKSQRVVSDMVGTMGYSGAGGVELTATASGLVAVSLTYSNEASGTYGQYIPATSGAEALGGGADHLLAGLAGLAGFHTNVGILNLSDIPLSVDFDLYRADGTMLGSRRVTAPEGAFAQAVKVFDDLTDDEVRGGYAVLRAADQGALFMAYASIVDDGSHDPTFIPAVPIDSQSRLNHTVPAVASNPGRNQTTWRSDLTIVNLGDRDATVEIELHPVDTGPILTELVDIASGASLHLPDIVASTFSSEGSGWLRLASGSGSVFAVSRTYNDDATGTFGQFIPAVDRDDFVLSGESVVLAGLSSADGFRTNIGLTSLADVETTVMGRVFSDTGLLVGELAVPVPAGQFVQLDRVLQDRFDYLGTAWAILWSDDPAASFVAHASVVDGSSGDPVYIPASVAPSH